MSSPASLVLSLMPKGKTVLSIKHLYNIYILNIYMTFIYSQQVLGILII